MPLRIVHWIRENGAQHMLYIGCMIGILYIAKDARRALLIDDRHFNVGQNGEADLRIELHAI